MTAEPEIRVRDLSSEDVEAAVRLLAEIDFQAPPGDVQVRLERLQAAGDICLVAEMDDSVAGLLTVHLTPLLHRSAPVARITLLVVAESRRGQGVGRSLVDQAELEARGRGCTIMEVISNGRYEDAHLFYGRLGYELTSHKFKKVFE